MAGFLRSLFCWNNINSSKTLYRRTNLNGPINLYRRTNLNNNLCDMNNGWYSDEPEQSVWREQYEQPERPE
jgi:hypothetical protein